MYSLSAYGKMIVDQARMDAYVHALRQAIRPGSVVVDLGCGPGLFALVACELGARRVFAIEPNDVIQAGREAAREHGFSDRIEFIQEFSTKISLPEQADVIVSDLRGVLPWFGHHVDSIIDARTRFRAPEGVLIPARDFVWVSIVETPERYEEIVGPWNRNGFRLNSARNLAVNTWRKVRVQAGNFLTEPLSCYELHYDSITEINFHALIDMPIARKGAAHGLLLWFDTELIDGIGFSNAPGGEELIYGQAFFPFKEPIDCDAGDLVHVRLEARLIGDDYVWRWDTTVSSQNEPKISFKQSTLFGTPLSPAKLRKRAHTFVPTANDDGAITRFVLSQMDGANSIENIATALMKEFTHRFSDLNEALNVVAEISEKYSV
jgi:protein arginine N-methyltransferase 1